jgi:alkylhydroperoxidase family enzyme
MAFIEQIEGDQANGVLARVYDAARNRAGGVANIIRVMSQDGASTQASMAFYVSIMKRDNALAPAQREMLATVVSNVNDCYY